MIRFGTELRDPRFARDREFIIVAGDGWCSSSLGGNTRKYHGLFVWKRRVYLPALDEFVNGKRISAATYEGWDDCGGLGFLTGFSLYPPTFTYRIGDLDLVKEIRFDGTLHIRYSFSDEAEFTIKPLVTDRSIHETLQTPLPATGWLPDEVRAGRLTLRSTLPFVREPVVYHDIVYEADRERGYDYREDLGCPGYFHGIVRGGDVEFKATVEGAGTVAPPPHIPSTEQECLKRSAQDFLVRKTIFAGYHWFPESWGRDTFISLPGLLVDEGRYRECEDIFRGFLKRMRRGLIPNRHDAYNSSDASLWFLYALRYFAEHGGSRRFLGELRPSLEQLLYAYPESGIARLDGGLISVAPSSTWMDTPATPREGKPVEVNALWISSLMFAEDEGIEPPVQSVDARREFERFWNPRDSSLFDVLDPADPSVRPNQVIAVALGTVDGERAEQVMKTVRSVLLTPVGLRTLTPHDPRFQGVWNGDASYHNGCVWPWLIGFYDDAARRCGLAPPPLGPLLQQVWTAGLGSISEIFDGAHPHRPRGCISQAWSVAEVLRAWRHTGEGGANA